VDDDVEEDEGDNAEDEVEDDKVEDDDVAEDEVEDDDVKGEEDDDVEEDRSQDCGPHFLRACAIEMHRIAIFCEISQVKCCTAPQTRQALCASLRSRNALGHVTGAILCGNLQGKCRNPD